MRRAFINVYEILSVSDDDVVLMAHDVVVLCCVADGIICGMLKVEDV